MKRIILSLLLITINCFAYSDSVMSDGKKKVIQIKDVSDGFKDSDYFIPYKDIETIELNTTIVADDSNYYISLTANSTSTIFSTGISKKDKYDLGINYHKYDEELYSIQNIYLNLNTIYDFDWIEFKAGILVGYSQAKLLESDLTIVNDTSDSFAYGANAMVSVPVTNNISILIKYDYLKVDHISVTDEKEITLIDNISISTVGLNYRF